MHCEKCGARLEDAEPGFRDSALAAAGAATAAGATVAAGIDEMLAAGSAAAPGSGPGSQGAGETLTAPRSRRNDDGEPEWLNSALVVGTAVFAAIALIGVWWNLRAPYVDPVPKPPAGLTAAPFNSGNSLPAPAAASVGTAVAAAPATDDASAALAAADAAASAATADVASARGAPLTASAATAALTARATALPSSPSSSASPTAANNTARDAMTQMLSRRNAMDAGNVARPSANADLPAHFDNEDIGPIAADAAQHAAAASAASKPGAASAASAASAAGTAGAIAAALAQCDRYRWYEVIPKQRCIWAVCNGRWGKDGCPAGTNPGESH
ncbi:hypothetical protein [Pandoraea pulmonicola]|uniref:Uncharacterized protein n=1 Tax=Pandoraea pulmonicola TaxID=93221 RepID=A0ABN4EPE7_PANPU|nr:hypothetical protein [Pandoraea pulmonicola]AJC20382.1 hypothetical protein RO07_07690 [Pandoraea pulmonicola]